MRRALALAAALLLAGCGGTEGTAAVRKDGSVDLSKVTLHVGDQKAGSQALLRAAGGLSGVRYRIVWSQFTSGPPLLEAVNAGAVDLGGVGNTPPIFAAAANSKIKAVEVSNQRMDGQAILVPKNSAIRTLADLRGKRIAVAKGSSANYHLLAALRRTGLTFKDIQPNYLQPADALAAFDNGKVDAWAIWDPYTAQAQAKTGARILVNGYGLSNGYSFQVAGTKALKDKAKVAAIRDYLSRLEKAQVWANVHQKQWAQVWAQQTGLSAAVTTVAARRRIMNPVPLDDRVVASEQQIADAFTGAKLIPGKVKFADFTDRRFNDLVGGRP